MVAWSTINNIARAPARGSRLGERDQTPLRRHSLFRDAHEPILFLGGRFPFGYPYGRFPKINRQWLFGVNRQSIYIPYQWRYRSRWSRRQAMRRNQAPVVWRLCLSVD